MSEEPMAITSAPALTDCESETIEPASVDMSAPSSDLKGRIDAVVAVASRNAEAIDRAGRLPKVAVEELWAQRLGVVEMTLTYDDFRTADEIFSTGNFQRVRR
jgi:hypothetical protein